MFLVCLGVSAPFLVPAAGTVVGLGAAASASAAATVADGLTPVIAGYVIDDNASIPPTAAVAGGVVVAATGAAPVVT
jgi:hypothetical protein